tara:strand:+ start:475 stop:1866 length:1392 start_codon:yes stop_codon:yes gene_type:complete
MDNLKEFIIKLIKEYGTGAGGRNHPKGGGNLQTSPRPFPNEKKEMMNYILKNIYGGDGGHYTHEPAFQGRDTVNFNRLKMTPMTELKKYITEILEELDEQAYGSATLTTQGQLIHRAPGVWQEDEKELKEQANQAAQRSYEAGLKRLQKAVLRYQLRYIEKQRAAAISQAATAQSQASKGFDEQIKALLDQIRAIDNPPKAKKKTNENYYKNALIAEYWKNRNKGNLMEYIDSYKKTLLYENTVRKLFRKFNRGESNENITKNYAKKGITIPETFLSKIRKQYENLKKIKLEIDLAEQEAQDVITVPTRVPDLQLFDLEPEEDKQLSSRLYKEQKTVKKYDIPPEIKHALEDDLKMYPLIRFVKGLKAVNSIPPSYRIFLLNDQYFDLIYEEYSLMAKIGIDEYYLGDLDERNYAVKHINRLMTKPILKTQGEEDEDISPSPVPKPPTPSPSPSPTPKPEDEE